MQKAEFDSVNELLERISAIDSVLNRFRRSGLIIGMVEPGSPSTDSWGPTADRLCLESTSTVSKELSETIEPLAASILAELKNKRLALCDEVQRYIPDYNFDAQE